MTTATSCVYRHALYTVMQKWRPPRHVFIDTHCTRWCRSDDRHVMCLSTCIVRGDAEMTTATSCVYRHALYAVMQKWRPPRHVFINMHCTRWCRNDDHHVMFLSRLLSLKFRRLKLLRPRDMSSCWQHSCLKLLYVVEVSFVLCCIICWHLLPVFTIYQYWGFPL